MRCCFSSTDLNTVFKTKGIKGMLIRFFSRSGDPFSTQSLCVFSLRYKQVVLTDDGMCVVYGVKRRASCFFDFSLTQTVNSDMHVVKN